MAGIQDDQYRGVGMRRDPGYRPPASGRVGLQGAPPVPAGHVSATYNPTGQMYAAGPSRNEADQLSSFMASVPDHSPWSRFQADRGRDQQIAANVNAIANDRSSARYYAPQPQSRGPIGVSAPAHPALAHHTTLTPAPPAMIPDPSKVAAAQAGPDDGPHPGFTPREPFISSIVRSGPVNGTPNVMPIGQRAMDPTRSIRRSPPPPKPTQPRMDMTSAQQSGPSPAGVADAMRSTLVGHFDAQMAEALTKGDMNTYAEVAAQRGALDSGGYVGLQNHVDERSMARAKLQESGARVGLANSKSGQATTPEEAAAAMFGKTGNQDAADHAAFLSRRIAKQFDPEDSQRILETEYPSTKGAFSTAPDGTPNQDLHAIHAQLKAINPKGFSDPGSDFARAAKARIAQMFGSELPNQLFVPPQPIRQHIGGPGARWIENVARNAMHGTFDMNPIADYDRRSAAANWYNAK